MENDPHIVPTVISAVIIVATALWVLVNHVRTRPRRPRVGVPTMDLGPEPPAIVDLLTDDFAVTSEAVPATLVDLAARRWLTIEEVGGGDVVVRVSARDRNERLAPYERRVLEHVRSLAIGGVVPAAAMTTGPEAVSKRWWRSFRHEVIADAQARGLSRDRWSKAMLAPVGAGVFAAGGLAWLAIEVGPAGDELQPPGWTTAFWLLTVLATVALGVWASTAPGRALQRDTDAGLAAAARWVAVRQYMATVGDFEDKPAAMVALWDRYLAHAVALDLAPLVVAQLPLGAEDHRHAWSRASGRWRQVRVRYPRLRPGYGQHPAAAFLGALVVGALAAGALGLARRVGGGDFEILTDLPAGVDRGVELASVGVTVVAGIVLAWNAVKLLYAIVDFVATDSVEGTVIRRRVRIGRVRLSAERSSSSDDSTTEHFFCALDTGEHPVVTAWRVRRSIFEQVRQGDRCRMRVTRHLRHVREVAPVVSVPGGDQ